MLMLSFSLSTASKSWNLNETPKPLPPFFRVCLSSACHSDSLSPNLKNLSGNFRLSLYVRRYWIKNIGGLNLINRVVKLNVSLSFVNKWIGVACRFDKNMNKNLILIAYTIAWASRNAKSLRDIEPRLFC